VGRDENLERRRGEPQSRGEEGSMWEEQRERRIIKEEKKKRRNLEVMASMCSVNLENVKSPWFSTSFSVHVPQEHAQRKSLPAQRSLKVESSMAEG